MKNKFLTVFLLFCTYVYPQFGPQQIIATEASFPVMVFTADIDGDGNLDVLSASRYDNNIAWYRNLDGAGTFGPLNLLGPLSEAYSIYAADLDNDGDIDVLAASPYLNLVVWYENLDGLGNFSSQKILSNNADGAFSAIAADLDGDGDNDIVSASINSGLAWYENIDGQGNFSATKIIDNVILSSRSVVAADIDGDGDLDLVSNGNAPGVARIVWYENLDGLGTFGPRRVIRDFAVYANVIFVADADGDGDMDVFSASNGDNEVAWHENLDGLGNFGPKIIITSSLPIAFTVYAADLDNDGDMDVLATRVENFGGEIVWFENLDGLGTFSEKRIISADVQSPRSVIAADLDNDGDLDVISASQNDNKIAWYENMTIIGIEENRQNSLKVYPNPTKGILFLSYNDETITRVLIVDILGKTVLQFNEDLDELNISNLQNGMYFLKATTQTGDLVQKIIKE